MPTKTGPQSADVQQKLNTLISDQTRLSLLSFIESPEAELEKMEDEAPEFINDPEEPTE